MTRGRETPWDGYWAVECADALIELRSGAVHILLAEHRDQDSVVQLHPMPCEGQACSLLEFQRAVAEGRDINVPDVHAISNYLACSLETVSELVVLIRDPDAGEIHGQLDLDSDRRDAFTERDERELKVVAVWLAGLFTGEAAQS